MCLSEVIPHCLKEVCFMKLQLPVLNRLEDFDRQKKLYEHTGASVRIARTLCTC